MKSFIALGLLVAACIAAPQSSPDADAQITRSDLNNIGVDRYSYNTDTSNGISEQEQGQLSNPGAGGEVSPRGQYSYTGPEGVVYTVTYRR